VDAFRWRSTPFVRDSGVLPAIALLTTALTLLIGLSEVAALSQYFATSPDR
jgi:hypothetical protein